jgi:hypothetical protein
MADLAIHRALLLRGSDVAGTSSQRLRYQRPIAYPAASSDPAAMTTKRVITSLLWIYSCWVAGGLAEFFIGTPALLGLAAGIAAAVFFGLDPLGVVRPKTEKALRVERSPSVETTPAIGSVIAQ